MIVKIPLLLLLLFGQFNLQVFTAQVIGVLDGDTIEVLLDKTTVRIRIDAIDCPEKTQAFGNRAKQFTSDFCFGKTVSILKKDIDRYGRTIARVSVDDKDLSQELIKSGLAWHYKRYSDDQILSELEIEARKQSVGLWSDPAPVPPWCFRKPQNCLN